MPKTLEDKIDGIATDVGSIKTDVAAMKVHAKRNFEVIVDHEKRIRESEEAITTASTAYQVDKAKIVGGASVAGVVFGLIGAFIIKLIEHFWK